MNTTLIEGKSPAEYDATVLNTISLIPNAPHHEAVRRLLIGVRNERGDVYRAIKVFGMKEFSDLIEKFRGFGYDTTKFLRVPQIKEQLGKAGFQ